MIYFKKFTLLPVSAQKQGKKYSIYSFEQEVGSVGEQPTSHRMNETTE